MAGVRSRMRPVGELLFLSGGVGLAALALATLVRADGAAAIVLSLTSFVSAVHVGATLLRARRARRSAIALAGIVLALFGAAVVVRGGLRFFDALFVLLAIVLPAHVALQSFRAAVVVALREGGQVRRGPFVAAAVGGALASAVAVFTGAREMLIVRGALTTGAGTVLWAALSVVTLLLGIRAARGTRAEWRVLTALVTPPLLAGAPLALGGVVAADWALTGPSALAHAAQLLALALVLEPRVARLEERAFDPAAWLAGAVALGVLLVIDAPLAAARLDVAGVGDPTTWMLAVAGCVTLVQALLDVPLWSLHDPTLLRAAGEAVVPAGHGRHAVSNARAVLVSVPIAIVLAFAAFEPMQTVLLSRADPEAYALARTLFPGDVRITVADAQEALAGGDVDAARAALDRAERAISADAVRLAVLVCIHDSDADPDADATACFADLPSAFRDDVELGLAHVVELDATARFTEALAVARRIAAARPDDERATLLLGIALARAGAPEAGATLDRGLDAREVRAQPMLDALSARAAAWRARVALDAGHRDVARSWIERARETAVAQDLPDVGVLVFVTEAALADASNDARKSLESLKVALGAAQDTDRPVDHAAAWLTLEALLGRSAAAPPARYACIKAAERALEPLGDREGVRAVRARLSDARRALVPYLADGDRARVDAELDAALAEVLALSYPAADGPDAAAGVVEEGLVDGGPSDNNDAP